MKTEAQTSVLCFHELTSWIKFFNFIIDSQSLSLSPTWDWDSATWTDSTYSPTIRFTSRIRILCLCLGCRRNRLFSKRDIIMNRSSAVAPESCWTTLIVVPRAVRNLLSLEQVRRPTLAVSQTGLTVTKETAAMHIIYSQSARAPVYQLNRPPGHK